MNNKKGSKNKSITRRGNRGYIDVSTLRESERCNIRSAIR